MEEVKSLTLKPREERRLQRGHLWVYRNELERDPLLPDGAVVDVFTDARRFVGRGFYQAAGGIAARLLSRRQEEIDEGFFRARLAAAQAWRARIFPGEDVYRMVFGESDGLPGLVVDRYGPLAVAHAACAFYRRFQEALLPLLGEIAGVRGVIVEMQGTRAHHGEVHTPLEVAMEGVRLELDLREAQKTGLFLDQRWNSREIRRYAAGAAVLDGHCYHGIWTCHAALGGAAAVTAVDTSAPAVEQARRNAALNGVTDKCTFHCGDVEELLKANQYDVVVLDPPAFAKSRAQTKKALSRYQALNTNAMKALAPGGILITSSCSHFVSAEEFLEVLKRAAAAAHRQTWLLGMHGAAPDHPVLVQMPETRYLKCAMMRVGDKG
ncbi:MAG: class I SAM-dependent rRNA methyltransferase [Candidatus Hydrogenedentes bacterium]|nr:class I SAM-dependent rRNA methyltransferase [Candidatus Hydrogenedentota bacterium]